MRKKLLFLVSAIAISAAASASTHRMATYNIRYINFDPDTGGKNWTYRGPVCRDVILNYDFDIVGFQEVGGAARKPNSITGKTQLEDLRAWLPDYEVIAWDRDKTKQSEYVATAYKKNRYELLDQGSFFIAASPSISIFGWDTHIESHSRVLGWLKLKDKESGEVFIYATTHTNDGWSLDGPYGSQLVAKTMKEIAGDLPVMVVADYNSNRVATNAYKGLKEYWATFHDAALDVPADKNYSLPVTNRACTWTYNAFHPVSEANYTGSEIDFQFYKGMKILERHIVTEEFVHTDGTVVPSSDHFPLFVVAELNPVQQKSYFVDSNASAGGDGSVTSPFKTISEATSVADIDDMIYVAAGTYRESVQPHCTVSILGGYTDGFSQVGGTSVIEGEGLKTPQIYAPGAISLTLKDLTIRGYNSPGKNIDGAIHFKGADLSMENIVVEDNTGVEYGGGLSVINATDQKYCECNNLTLLNCTFKNNTANYGAAIAASFYDQFDIDGCTFEGNAATKSGGALYVSFGTPESNRIWFTEAKALITNSSFVNNSSKTSGTIVLDDNMPNVKTTIANTTFAGNTIEAKGGLAAVVRTYGGTAVHGKLTSRPADSPLSKVNSSKLMLGHVTIVGNHASSSAPTNFKASAVTVDGGEVKIVNSIIAANSTNGAEAFADITINNGTLSKETLNIFTISFTADEKSHSMASQEEGINAIATMMAGDVTDGKYMPYVNHTDAEPTPFVPLKSTDFGGTNVATLTVLQRNIEKEFSIDIDRDGTTGTQTKTDQLRHSRNAKSMPGAVEFSEEYSANPSIEADATGNNVEMQVLSDGQVQIRADKPLGTVSATDLMGRRVSICDTADNELTLDLSSAGAGLYIIMCLGNTYKILK